MLELQATAATVATSHDPRKPNIFWIYCLSNFRGPIFAVNIRKSKNHVWLIAKGDPEEQTKNIKTISCYSSRLAVCHAFAAKCVLTELGILVVPYYESWLIARLT